MEYTPIAYNVLGIRHWERCELIKMTNKANMSNKLLTMFTE